MAKLATAILVATALTIAACATPKGYVICNDLAPNTTCPDNTANVVVGM